MRTALAPIPDDGDAPAVRTFHHLEFRAAELAARKGATTVSVCLPARNEAATVGPIVECLRRELVEAVPLVDEILVVDDHSTDRTAQVAAAAGARVVDAADVLAELGPGQGKGAALWRSLAASTGDLVVWCDADLLDFSPRFVTGVVGPLLTEPTVHFVKGFYDRPEVGGSGGGRVTELVARPLLSLCFPHLTSIRQPLGGEYGGRRSLLERLPFVHGYGVDVGLLIDAVAEVGLPGVAQVDLELRRHRNRPLDELASQAASVMQTVLRKAHPSAIGAVSRLVRPEHPPVEVDVRELPPLRDPMEDEQTA